MPPLTLNGAAKAAKKSKAALLDAIHSGRLSATRNDLNQWQIEPCELFRVYPPTTEEPTTTGFENHNQPVDQNRITTLLEQQLQFAERERRQMQETIEDLRRRLDRETEERQRLMLMLTHQQAQAAEQPKHNGNDNNRLLQKLFGRRP